MNFCILTEPAVTFGNRLVLEYLLYAAMKAGADITAYYVRTVFQPQFELDDAMRLARELSARLKILDADVLSSSEVSSNPPDRCYHCKAIIMGAISRAASEDGYPVIIDGTNASDDISDRPGVRALREYGIRSPLRECFIGKEEIRRRSREAGLFTWDKPAYACLATRIPTGEKIDAEKLRITEEAEDFLRSIGFSDFRVRMLDGKARIQLQSGQFPLLIENREKIVSTLGKLYGAVLLDLEARND